MHPNNIALIKSIAKECREECEQISKKRDNGHCYDLNGACAFASLLIYTVCRKFNIDKVEVLEGEGHCCTKVEDLYVDVTLTQFGRKKRIFVARHRPRIRGVFKGLKRHAGIKPNTIIKDMLERGWCPFQVLPIQQVNTSANRVIKKLKA